MEYKKPVLTLVIFILIAAAINCPLATHFLKSRTDSKGRIVATLTLAEAAALGWPAATPHKTEWPRPQQRQETESFGYRHIQIWSVGSPHHQMEYQLIGWPLPVYEQVQMWWPWNDPAWQTTEQSDPALRLYWPGVILNPIIVGGGAWLILVVPFFAVPAIRRQITTRIRRKRGHCPKCGYDLRGELDAGCPECGWRRDSGTASD